MLLSSVNTDSINSSSISMDRSRREINYSVNYDNHIKFLSIVSRDQITFRKGMCSECYKGSFFHSPILCDFSSG